MSRARNIKPGFFKNDRLAECEPLARILFAALWCEADREGRLEDRPKRIKAECLPYDDCHVPELLDQLQRAGFIHRYEVAGERYIAVLNFAKHQNPHVKEAASTIPAPVGLVLESEAPSVAPDKPGASPVLEQGKHEASPADSLLLIPDSPSPKKSTERVPRSLGRFEDFWQAYPNKKGRKDAEKAWARKGLDAQADLILADVRRRQVHDRDWVKGYVPHGSTYVNAEGWRDGLPPVPLPQTPQMQPSRQMQAIQNILGVTLENDSPARLVLDLDASRPGADVRALPPRLAGC